jgi:hypothetical protein
MSSYTLRHQPFIGGRGGGEKIKRPNIIIIKKKTY